MPRTVELPDDLADALIGQASRLGMSLPEDAVRLLRSAPLSAVSVGSGKMVSIHFSAQLR